MAEERIETDTPPISERVKFWEEQDKINQELIPRVIRQHEILASHIADHENLPLIAGNAIREALVEARQQQQAQHDAEMAELRAEAEEQRRQHESELQAAKVERQQQAEALAEVKAEHEEQARKHQAELAAAKSEREEQRRQYSTEVATLQEQLRKAKTLLIGVASGAAVISIVSLVVGIVV